MTFNAAKELRNHVSLNDTLNILFIPVVQSYTGYSIHRLTITVEGYGAKKEKVIKKDTVIANFTTVKPPSIKIPIKDHIPSGFASTEKIFVDIESIEAVRNGKLETVKLPNSQMHQAFSFVSQ